MRVNDVLWDEAASVFGSGPRERVYTTGLDDSGAAILQFGDGINGARLPSGQDNLDATYRKGIGLEGLVRADSLTTLLSQPLGVSKVTNPLPADGADDPEPRDGARENAPITVLTLDRAVSLRDYEDYARGFSGIAKALATWSWDGHTRRVFLTVAGPNGAVILPAGSVYKRLLKALKGSGDPFVEVVVKTYRPAAFRLKLKVQVDPSLIEEKVLAAVDAALREAFGFRARAFGQPVVLSQVIATVHSVTGVVAVDVDHLYRTTPPNATLIAHPVLPSAPPDLDADGNAIGAELLTLEDGPIEGLEVIR
ncbi:MAG: putative baseplate assembly protein [bacterium]|nr:putative baseplate assembly protein [bacterium]